MTKALLVLANSIRPGGRCISGREMFQRGESWFYGPWIRPVSQHGEGEVAAHESTCSDGTQPAVLDVVQVPLTAKQACSRQPENYLIDSAHRWQKLGTIPADSLGALVERPAHLWLEPGGHTDRVPSRMALGSLNPFGSLYLIRPKQLRFRIWEAVDDFRGRPRKQRRALFSYAGTEYNLPITDPTMEARYFRPFPALNQPPREIVPRNAANCLLVVSLTLPFRDGYQYKVVATILEC